MSKLILPNYKKCITNLASSIQKEFGLVSHHTTLQSVDTILNQKEYTNIVVFLLDGLGAVNINQTLDKTAFLRQNMIDQLTAVCTASTVPATTAFRTGLNPNETGLLGWTNFNTENQSIFTPFRPTKDLQSPPDYGSDWLHSLHSWFNDIPTIEISKYSKDQDYQADQLEDILTNIIKATKLPFKKFIFAYSDEPDHIYHENGWESKTAKRFTKNLNKIIQEWLPSLNTNTKLFIIADHGHATVNGYIDLRNHPNLLSALKIAPTIETRVANFFIKDGMQEYATNLLNEILNPYQDNPTWIIFTKEEVKKMHLFGTGKDHPKFDSQLGDLLAVSTDDSHLGMSDVIASKKGAHGSLTEEEMLIPLIVY